MSYSGPLKRQNISSNIAQSFQENVKFNSVPTFKRGILNCSFRTHIGTADSTNFIVFEESLVHVANGSFLLKCGSGALFGDL